MTNESIEQIMKMDFETSVNSKKKKIFKTRVSENKWLNDVRRRFISKTFIKVEIIKRERETLKNSFYSI